MSDRKKAIETLKQLRLDYEEFYEEHNNEVTQAYDMAIASLETDEMYQLEYEKPSLDDFISWAKTVYGVTLVSLGVYKQVAWERDIAIQQLHELGYEFGQKIEPTAKNDLGVDCISRVKAIDAFPDLLPNMGYNKKAITEILQEVPPVIPQEPINSVLEDIKTNLIKRINNIETHDLGETFVKNSIINEIEECIRENNASLTEYKTELQELTSDNEGFIKSRFGIDRVFVDKDGYLYNINGNSLAKSGEINEQK